MFEGLKTWTYNDLALHVREEFFELQAQQLEVGILGFKLLLYKLLFLHWRVDVTEAAGFASCLSARASQSKSIVVREYLESGTSRHDSRMVVGRETGYISLFESEATMDRRPRLARRAVSHIIYPQGRALESYQRETNSAAAIRKIPSAELQGSGC